MNPKYDRPFAARSGLGERSNIYHLNGIHAAVLNGGGVYGHRGQQLRGFANYLFRNHLGGVVGFTRGCSGGPVPPAPLVPSALPVSDMPSVPREPAVPMLGWGSEC
jgi:hypothetical protein